MFSVSLSSWLLTGKNINNGACLTAAIKSRFLRFCLLNVLNFFPIDTCFNFLDQNTLSHQYGNYKSKLVCFFFSFFFL